MRERQDIGTVFLKTVGQNIADRRKECGYSMEFLGEKVGLNAAKIHRIENGYNITLTTILKLSIALEVNPEDLVPFNASDKQNELSKLVRANKKSKLKSKK